MRVRDSYLAARRMSFLGLLLVGLTFIGGMGWLVLGMVSRSFVSEDNASVEIPGLSGKVEIARDRYGIPYILAETENDAMTALGYAHAQDRLWQMDLFRRVGQGRLSELMGTRLIGYDAYVRTIGFERIARNIFEKMPPRTKATVEAYCRGVNRFIETHQGRYPFEFDALGYQPEPWEPIHTILVIRLLAWEQNKALWTDLIFERIRSRVDSSLFTEMLPWYPSYGPTIIPGEQRPEPQLEALRAGMPQVQPTDFITTDSTEVQNVEEEVDSTTAKFFRSLDPLIELDRSMRAEIGIGGSEVGSNGWVISGDRTTNGKPILANDPHLQHSVPGKWYQGVLKIGKRTLAGVTIPGMPFIVAGRNDDIAWGLTNLMADETDFYLERLHTEKKDRALHDGVWEPLQVIKDTVHAKDTLPTPIEIRISRHGPLVSDLRDLFEDYKPPLLDSAVSSALIATPADSFGLALRWLGRNVSHELTALQKLNAAKNFLQFRDALKHGGVPGLSILYADRHGTIGYVPCLRSPIRNAANPYRVNPGWDSRYNWRGAHQVSKMPTLKNPDQGFIASANNKITNFPGLSIPGLWVDPSRAIRLEEYLDEGNEFQVIDCVQMQGDVLSEHMRYMVEFLIRAFPDSAQQGRKVREGLALLHKWDGEMNAESPEASIAAEWSQIVYEKTWKDELGESVYRHFMLVAQLPLKNIRRQLMTNSRWFDDVTTPQREVRDDILRKSFGDALDSLHNRFGTWNVHEWKFGKIHTLTFRHPFSATEQLRNVVNIGPFEVGGATTTLNNGEWEFNRPYDVELGPSMRQIVDFADTTVFLRSVLATGQSGQPMNGRYQDQTIIWLYNGYVSLYSHRPSKSETLSITRLVPG
ncbi:MAG: penicillin acylase family protein [Chlorobi bacterium]|nr:penicillin acylase family protein [Chlorobiota bacterium]